MLAPALTRIINESFITGIFPKELKVAKIIPIHKTGKRDDVNNYRPISILPAISKIVETAIEKQRMSNFLESKMVFSNSQYGFRPGRSTTTALIEVVEEVTESFDNKQEVALTCCDISKAFDTIDHEILLMKLEHYGIRGQAQNLIASFLSRRTQ